MSAPKWLATDDKPQHAGKDFEGSGSFPAYSVEARDTYGPARADIIPGIQLDTVWRPVSFQRAQAGVPIGPSYSADIMERCGVMSYPAAQALRWWLHAQAEAGKTSGLCLETRLVEHRVKYSITHTAVSVHAVIGGDDRSSMRPAVPLPAPPEGAPS